MANGFYTLGAAPAATCDATDSFSGLDTCKVTVTGGTANGVGTFSWTATATDKAGNSVSQTGTYKVVYKFDGFLQPINDTAHQVGTSTSVFKAGSTIPVKFQLKNAAGTAVQSAAAPVWLTPVKGGAMSLPVDETVQTVTADSGSTFRYDAGSTSTTGRPRAPVATTTRSASSSTTARRTTSTSAFAESPPESPGD